ncbi:hypothetical protein G6O67_004969 [Ophiocordyceps sinensis]|uniref:Uncharacterized protein n=1 Tax=Ophiocordyceps sinensis TaxID=72228 RepID=A0A8H4PQI0_9HYPO|nr:hypothetical protein G6O67_004969 [Ophiocordyceps sinensis]
MRSSLAAGKPKPRRPANSRFGRARARPRRTRADRVEPAGLAFRRDVYRHLRYSIFRHNEELQRRARTFLRRDLRVFSWLTTPDVDNIMPHAGESPQSFQDRRRATTVERLLGHILWLLQHFELRGSDGSVEEVVTTHLGRENTRLLLHELHSFLRSPYLTLEDWDRAVQYPDSSQSRSVGFDEIGGPGPLTGHRAADQRSAPNRFRGRDRQRRGPELARAGPAVSKLMTPLVNVKTMGATPLVMFHELERTRYHDDDTQREQSQ